MQPQGTAPTNPDVFQQLTAEVNQITVCADLQAFVARAFATISAEEAAIQSQIAALAPILKLLTIPAVNPAAIVSWISDFISGFLTPYYKPQVTLLAQLTQLATEVAALTAAIEAAASRITNCSVLVPAIPAPPSAATTTAAAPSTP